MKVKQYRKVDCPKCAIEHVFETPLPKGVISCRVCEEHFLITKEPLATKVISFLRNYWTRLKEEDRKLKIKEKARKDAFVKAAEEERHQRILEHSVSMRASASGISSPDPANIYRFVSLHQQRQTNAELNEINESINDVNESYGSTEW